MSSKNVATRAARATHPAGRHPPRRGVRLMGKANPIFLSVVIVVIVALGVASVMFSTPEPAAKTFNQNVEITGAALAPFDGASDETIGRTAPELRGEDFTGEPVSITRDGRPKIVLFLAHWCSHCRTEVTEMQAWLDTNGLPDGVDLYSVSTMMDPTRPNYPPDEWLANEGWTLPVLVDGHDLASESYGLTSTPYWVVLDDAGRVVLRHAGNLVGSLDDVVAALSR